MTDLISESNWLIRKVTNWISQNWLWISFDWLKYRKFDIFISFYFPYMEISEKEICRKNSPDSAVKRANLCNICGTYLQTISRFLGLLRRVSLEKKKTWSKNRNRGRMIRGKEDGLVVLGGLLLRKGRRWRKRRSFGATRGSVRQSVRLSGGSQ